MIRHNKPRVALNGSTREKKTQTMESVYEGWLTKSPRNKTGLLGLFATWQHWRHRYFVLFATSSKVVLNYYEDEKLQKRKGTIDLEHCEEIVDNVESSYYRYIFLLRTTHRRHQRTYYLAAESESQLKSWVEYLRSALNLQEDKQFFNKVQLGLQLSMKNSVSWNANRNSVCISRSKNHKETSVEEASVSHDVQHRVDLDGSTEKLGLANRNCKPESQISTEVGSLPETCLRFFIAGGSMFYSKADLGQAKSSAELESTASIKTADLTKESNFSSNESIEYGVLSTAAAKHSSTKPHSRINGTAISDKCQSLESALQFPVALNRGDAIANRLSATAAVDQSLGDNGADFQDSSSAKLRCYEYSLEEMEMIIFDDSKQLEAFEGEEETKNGVEAESNESYNRIFFSLARTKEEESESKGSVRCRSASSANRNYLCLTKGSRRYRRKCTAKP